MHFRLRHLNTGRLIVMQEVEKEGHTILTLGLSEHLGVNIKKEEHGNYSKCMLTCIDPEYQHSLETNSIFRLISTGVEMESGIMASTSVQI